MKMKKLTLVALPVLLLVSLIYFMGSFKTAENFNKISCQFSPVTGDFVYVELENCNNSKTAAPVAAGSTWSATLLPFGCDAVYISTSLPASHPAGTVNIYKNGSLIQSHTVAQNQPANFFDGAAAKSGDQFLVTW